jgi:drug/metabolite transporter (DMT)-like permease
MQQFFQRLFGRLYNAPYVLLVLTMLFWAGNINVGRYAADYVPPVALGTLRWIGAALILLPFAFPYLRADWPVIRKHVGMLTLLSLLSIAAYNTITYYGLQFTEAINAVILQAAGPLVMVACAFIIFGERLGRWQLVGMLLSIAGILVTVSRGDIDILLGLQFNIGDFILIGAIAAYSLYSVLLRRKPSMHPLSFVTVTMAWGAILLLPFFGAELATGRTVPLEPASFLIVAYVVIFPSLAAHFFFYRGVELIGSNRAAPFFYIIPVFATVMAIVFLGERLYFFHIAGFALILGGVVIASRQRTAATPEIRT